MSRSAYSFATSSIDWNARYAKWARGQKAFDYSFRLLTLVFAGVVLVLLGVIAYPSHGRSD